MDLAANNTRIYSDSDWRVDHTRMLDLVVVEMTDTAARPFEYCCLCDQQTGKAGAGDGSLYREDGEGPYCDQCWNGWRDDREECPTEPPIRTGGVK